MWVYWMVFSGQDEVEAPEKDPGPYSKNISVALMAKLREVFKSLKYYFQKADC